MGETGTQKFLFVMGVSLEIGEWITESRPNPSRQIFSSLYCASVYFCADAVNFNRNTQEAKYVERWPNTTSSWASWSRFDIPVDRYGGVHSLLICTSSPLGFPTCHQASQQGKYLLNKISKSGQVKPSGCSVRNTVWLYNCTVLVLIFLLPFE